MKREQSAAKAALASQVAQQPATDPEKTVPSPQPSPPDDLISPPQSFPAKPGEAPEYLNPDPNPLLRPTTPDEVKLRGIQPVTLQQALELAQRNNRTLEASQQQLRRSRAALREAQAEFYPTLDFQANLTNSRSASGQISALSSPIQSGIDVDRTSLSGSLVLNYDLFTSGGRPARIRASERQLRSDELQVEITLEQLRLDVSNDYYDLQQADESVRINESAVRSAEQNLKDAIALERAGLETRFSVLQFEVQLARARQNLTNALAAQRVRRRQLAQRLSVPPTINLAAADPVQVTGKWSIPLEESIILALKNRAELEQFLVQRELGQQQRRAALSTLGPTISLVAQYDVLSVFDDNLGTGDGYSVGARLRWSIFEGGAAAARARQQEANIALAETQFADALQQVRFQVESAYADLDSNLQNVDTATKALEQAQEALRLARLRFQAGVGTQTDVINADNNLTSARGDLVTAILGYNRAVASIKRATTNLTIGAGQTLPDPAP
jgi:OMF family outer membrane factor